MGPDTRVASAARRCGGGCQRRSRSSGVSRDGVRRLRVPSGRSCCWPEPGPPYEPASAGRRAGPRHGTLLTGRPWEGAMFHVKHARRRLPRRETATESLIRSVGRGRRRRSPSGNVRLHLRHFLRMPDPRHQRPPQAALVGFAASPWNVANLAGPGTESAASAPAYARSVRPVAPNPHPDPGPVASTETRHALFLERAHSGRRAARRSRSRLLNGGGGSDPRFHVKQAEVFARVQGQSPRCFRSARGHSLAGNCGTCGERSSRARRRIAFGTAHRCWARALARGSPRAAGGSGVSGETGRARSLDWRPRLAAFAPRAPLSLAIVAIVATGGGRPAVAKHLRRRRPIAGTRSTSTPFIGCGWFESHVSRETGLVSSSRVRCFSCARPSPSPYCSRLLTGGRRIRPDVSRETGRGGPIASSPVLLPRLCAPRYCSRPLTGCRRIRRDVSRETARAGLVRLSRCFRSACGPGD